MRETEIGFGQLSPSNLNDTSSGFSAGRFGSDRFYAVSGTIYSSEPFDHLSVQLVELAVPVTVAPNGRYIIQNLREGSYTVEVWTGHGDPSQHPIVVPSPPSEYDIQL